MDDKLKQTFIDAAKAGDAQTVTDMLEENAEYAAISIEKDGKPVPLVELVEENRMQLKEQIKNATSDDEKAALTTKLDKNQTIIDSMLSKLSASAQQATPNEQEQEAGAETDGEVPWWKEIASNPMVLGLGAGIIGLVLGGGGIGGLLLGGILALAAGMLATNHVKEYLGVAVPGKLQTSSQMGQALDGLDQTLDKSVDVDVMDTLKQNGEIGKDGIVTIKEVQAALKGKVELDKDESVALLKQIGDANEKDNLVFHEKTNQLIISDGKAAPMPLQFEAEDVANGETVNPTPNGPAMLAANKDQAPPGL